MEAASPLPGDLALMIRRQWKDVIQTSNLHKTHFPYLHDDTSVFHVDAFTVIRQHQVTNFTDGLCGLAAFNQCTGQSRTAAEVAEFTARERDYNIITFTNMAEVFKTNLCVAMPNAIHFLTINSSGIYPTIIHTKMVDPESPIDHYVTGTLYPTTKL